MSEELNNNNSQNSAPNPWSVLESSEFSPDPRTIQVEKSKELYLKTKERDERLDAAWGSLDDSNKSYFNANLLRTVDTLIENAKKQDKGEKPTEVAFTDEQIKAVKQINRNMRNLLIGSGVDKEELKQRSAESTVAGVALDLMGNGESRFSADQMRAVLKDVSPIILSMNTNNNHLGSLQMSTRVLDRIADREDRDIRRLEALAQKTS